ncbi:MAG: hypothetical protein Q8P18_18800 [Pseudomonadota bacterium]|nr:hypothetical protein [Pseudomonadota bacterium]
MAFLVQLLACVLADKGSPDDGAGPDDTGEIGVRTLEVRVVNRYGAWVPVDQVGWFDPTRLPVPLRPAVTAMVCADGLPPCAVWVSDRPLPEHVQVVTEQFGDGTWTDEAGFTCFAWDSPWTRVVVPRTASAQIVHLVVNTEQMWCDDGIAAEPVPALVPPVVHAEDERVEAVTPGDAPVVTVGALDPADLPLPLAVVNWYYPPESAQYDGEHPLTCADALCSTWVISEGEGPALAGPFYVSGTWTGPLHPMEDVTWTDYQGAPTELGATVALRFDTTVGLVE